VDRAVDSASASPRLGKPPIAFFGVLLAFLCLSVYALSRKNALVPVTHRPEPVSLYRNTAPGAKYIGDAACTRCHAEIAATYRLHPMGRSLAPIAAVSPPAAERGTSKLPFVADGLEYSVEKRDGHVFHQEVRRDAKGQVVTRNEAEVQFVVGSGRRGCSYLVNREGFLFESPMTWYSQKERWGLSPGFEVANFHFDRAIRPGCLYCHANRALPVPGPANRYRPPIFEGHAIGCERCHGPGELHATTPTVVDGTDTTIVNPANLEPALRDAVCEQCHLIGEKRIERVRRREEDYRPGLPLHRFLTVLTEPVGQASDRLVGQVQQMHASRCFRASEGRLGCISCHDPHSSPSAGQTVAYFRARCFSCHEDHGCSLLASERLKHSPENDCTGCHMPRGRSSDIPHTAVTNHRIPRQAASGSTSAGGYPQSKRLVPFHAKLMDAQERREVDRDIGIALCRQGEEQAREAIRLLSAALAEFPDDLEAREARGIALAVVGRDEQALTELKKALAHEPSRESTLVAVAYQAVKMDRRQEAVTYWLRAIAVNPWRSDYHGELALVYFRDRNWRASADACRDALLLNPSWVDVRRWYFQSLANLGEIDAAQRELAILLAFDPPDRAELLRQFSVASRAVSESR
jgi:predicted CXXCH cytochrome family protein